MLQDVEVDHGGVVHKRCVVFTRKNVARSAHIRGELVDDLYILDTARCGVGIAQISHDKLVCWARGKFRALQIHTPHTRAFLLEPFDQVPSDKSAGTAN